MEHIKVSLSKALTDKGFSATKTASLTSYGRSKSGEPTIQWHYHLHLNGKSPDSGARLKLLRDYANTGGYDELL